jgi:hypothetical protein
MDMGDGPTSESPPEGTRAPRLFASLPGRTEDTFTTYERCLTDLIDLLGAERPPLIPDTEHSRWQWQQQARQVIAQAVWQLPVQEEWFDPLVRAAIYEPNPSFNRQLVEPALAAYGHRRVQLALVEHLRSGTNPERAGAARAWYWTQFPLTYRAGSTTPTPERQADFEPCADVGREWQETALQVFVSNNDLDVRRCILPGLDLRVQHYPERLHDTVREAIRIARTHPDEYLRHRVEHQV